jgi:hypothetical protein
MGFEELIAMMRNPGEEGIPETIYDDLSASYTELSSTSSAALEQANGTVAQLQAELTAAKAHNYDLLMQVGIGSGDPAPEPEQESTEDDNIGGDDDFFEEKDND